MGQHAREIHQFNNSKLSPMPTVPHGLKFPLTSEHFAIAFT